MTKLSPEYRKLVQSMLDALPAAKKKVICANAHYLESNNDLVNTYRHFILLSDDLRYNVRKVGGGAAININKYVNRHYPKLIQRIRKNYISQGKPVWCNIESIESAGIHVVHDRKNSKLQFFLEGCVLTV